jgi:class 3 adenylate cyclase
MTLTKSRIECLILTLSFETLWSYYLQSSGQLFSRECREAAQRLIESFDGLSKQDPRIKDPVVLTIGEHTDVEDILVNFRDWADGKRQYPYEEAFRSRFMLFGLLTGLKGLLLKDLEVSHWPHMIMTSQETEFSERVLRWKGHLPASILRRDPDTVVKKASSALSVVVVADIRHSQDLMTYASSAEDFSRRMVDFIMVTRQSVDEHHGFFDKFTGDGYLVYFNEAVCNAASSDYIECFLSFIAEHRKFCIEHFSQWTQSVRKLPSDEVGLGIGADLGIVRFHDLKHQLVAVGDSIVWASRMATAARANEVVVNNLLFSALKRRGGLNFGTREATTKSGEKFLARTLEFDTRSLG